VTAVATLLLVVRLGLGTVFGVAAAAKLADRSGTRTTLDELGVPAPLTGPGAAALPAAELAVAALLAPATTARWGALGALALLLVFGGAIAVSLARGRRPDCNCFGRLHSRPLGPAMLVRNLALAGLAVAVVAAGPGRGIAPPPVRIDLGVALAALLAGQAWLSLELFLQNGRLLARVVALERGTPTSPASLAALAPAPSFVLPDLEGELHSLEELLAPGLPLALVFTDPNCPACEPLAARVAELREERAGELEIALVTRAGSPEQLGRFRAHGPGLVLVQERHEVFEAYRARAVPSAVVVGPDGRIQSPVETGNEAIEELLAPARESWDTGADRRAGQPALSGALSD
jgi:uncharacterized membrane protein YphA (DoxX/SURF4 family)